MDIPIKLILKKIEEEIKQSQTESDYIKVRDHLVAIQTLCGIVLERKTEPFNEVGPEGKTTLPNTMKRAVSVDDSEGNGDSLFDF